MWLQARGATLGRSKARRLVPFHAEREACDVGGRGGNAEIRRGTGRWSGKASTIARKVRESEEGMSTITRRTFLQGAAGVGAAALTGGILSGCAAGFGGAVKNCSIGIASSEGKVLIHSAGASTTSWGSPAQDDFLESMAEATKAVYDYMGGYMAFINVMNNLSVDCDCDSHPADPDMEDIGILASMDPVALDRACVDLVYAAPDGASLVERMESRNGAHTLEHAEAIGLGSQTYRLIDLDA